MAIRPHLLLDWNLDECNRVLKNIQAMVNRGGTEAASPTVTQTMAAQSFGSSSSGGSTPITLLGDLSGTGVSDITGTVESLKGVTVPAPISAEDGYFLQFNSSTGAYVLAANNGAVQRVLTRDLVVPAGYSYMVCGPLETNGHVLDISGIIGVF